MNNQEMSVVRGGQAAVFALKPVALVLAAFSPFAIAQDAAVDPVIVMPRVDVVGDRDELRNVPGSAEVVEQEELESSHVFTANEALRKVAGVNARDEEGFGLRPNIGIRGLNPTRSTKVTLLEDGVPLAYAPYGDNASYYHPPIERFERVEVLKGAGQILFGPQTIGGVINYITPTPPQKFGGHVSAAGGNRDYFNGKVQLGGRGMLLDYTRKQGEGSRDNIESELNDLNLKAVRAIGENQAMTLRANLYTEDSTVTYTGLTEAEYENFGGRYNPFDNDKFEGKRLGVSATHEWQMNDNAIVLTNIYFSDFSRDWWRQASTTTDGQCGAGFTNARLAGTAVDPDACNSIQGRLRDYRTWGVEPRLQLSHNAFGIAGELQAGVKAHFEEQNRKQVNGTSPTARSGTTVEDNLRETDAYSAFVMNRFDFGTWTLSPGLRYESIDSSRTNELSDVSGDDSLQRWIPSLGGTWNPNEQVTVFAGVHRGFAPPRTEDIISGTGTSTDVGPEDSTNWELGVRAEPAQGTSVQAAYFRNDFKRLIAVGSIAGGSTPLAEGEALFEGVELSGRYAHGSGVYVRGNYTWLPTAEQTTAFTQVVSGATVSGSAEGNRQPYAPKHMLTAALGYAKGPFDAQIEGVHVGEQYSDFANTEDAAAGGNGQSGKIDAYTIWNLALNYALPAQRTTLFLAVKNLADKTYIVDRTRGIQVGSPQLVHAGLKYEF